MLNKARDYAIKAHGNQKYGEHPYSYHLDAVVKNLADYGKEAKIVGYLHDIIEDTEITYDDIKNEFNDFTADCVAILTDEAGENRKERKAKTYKKMSLVTGDLELALIVKTADRLANVFECVNNKNKDLFLMYQNEHNVFKHSCFRPGLCDPLWVKLNKLIELEL